MSLHVHIMCSHVWMHTYVRVPHAYVCTVWRTECNVWHLPTSFSILQIEAWSLLNLRLGVLVTLASQLALIILCLHLWCVEITVLLLWPLAFMCGLGIWKPPVIPAQQVFYILSSLPSWEPVFYYHNVHTQYEIGVWILLKRLKALWFFTVFTLD